MLNSFDEIVTDVPFNDGTPLPPMHADFSK